MNVEQGTDEQRMSNHEVGWFILRRSTSLLAGENIRKRCRGNNPINL
jgi:ABC-type uncharacterized transport system permease subunit